MEANQKIIYFQELVDNLKEARSRKGLSQRALGKKVDLPQSHISKIESGKVDIKASSLIEIARALDLELMLVPRRTVPAVEALSYTNRDARRPSEDRTESDKEDRENTLRETHRVLERIEKDAQRLSRDLGSSLPEMERLADTARALGHLHLTTKQAEQIRTVLESVKLPKNSLKAILDSQPNLADILKQTDVARSLQEAMRATDSLRDIRNALAHGGSTPTMRSIPAYRLTDGNDDA